MEVTRRKPKLSRKRLEDRGVFFSAEVCEADELAENPIRPVQVAMLHNELLLPASSQDNIEEEMKMVDQNDDNLDLEPPWEVYVEKHPDSQTMSSRDRKKAWAKLEEKYIDCKNIAEEFKKNKRQMEVEDRYQFDLQHHFFKAFKGKETRGSDAARARYTL
ncbi:hypothetical protein P154DRAFT_615737 [Amniculicola lignicola CBS 123094]|uniref:Uncharacterized protein n=1 Tax=Amniculicola lignicola CBS 123094 TaxID=1392246 RepID=A0A6A5WVI6_9PLEO|nr:hypothetical protein P154DRAFT_615737 [Amniculicola lignicola CBS 123094]